MAFNFRPQSDKQIIAQKKKYSSEAVNVFNFIKKNYGATIVLDPMKDFSDIKIPRKVEKKNNI